MITQTIRESLLAGNTKVRGYVYVVRDGDVIFYVGISKDPESRLHQHMGNADGWNNYFCMPEELVKGVEKRYLHTIDVLKYGCSQVGICILDNAPESLDWSFDIYEKEDAIAIIERDEQLSRIGTTLLVIEAMQVEWYTRRDMVEATLIRELKPCLNVSMNRNGLTLPEKYRRQCISNKGIKL